MSSDFKPVSIEAVNVRLWEVAFSKDVDGTALRQHLGEPQFVERDELRTAGGEEEWWAYVTSHGFIAAVCLRVPYRLAAVCVSDPASPVVPDAVALLHPFNIVMNQEPLGR